MLKRFCVLGLALLLSACGGGGGGGGTASGGGATTTPALTNFATLTVDAGPAVLDTGTSPYISDNVAYVSVTLCAPGTSNCQTIDHVQVDTGSVGLRIVQSVLTPGLLAALPSQTDASANPVGECYDYVDGYAFGSVRQADFQIGGETVANMPLQVIGDGGVFANVPSGCSAGGGANLKSVQSLGANGIIGIGVTTTDCGSYCTTAGGYAAAIYYDCPATGCAGLIARSAAASAPFQQLPNPVAAMAVDNNGTIISLPAPAAPGSTTLTGTLYFGIGTQSNNALGSAKVIPTTGSTGANGEGLITIVYGASSLDESYIDSGSDEYFFVDSSISLCTAKDYVGYYCPPSPTSLALTLKGVNGASQAVSLTLNNAQSLLDSSYTALPGLGGDPGAFSQTLNAYPNSFALGLPFFYGRNVYTAIDGRSAGGVIGPYFAF